MAEPIVINGHEITDPYGLEVAPFLTPERATLVRHLRMEEDETWRGVAEECASAWGAKWRSHQGIGMALCQIAATYFDEDGMQEPWN